MSANCLKGSHKWIGAHMRKDASACISCRQSVSFLSHCISRTRFGNTYSALDTSPKSWLTHDYKSQECASCTFNFPNLINKKKVPYLTTLQSLHEAYQFLMCFFDSSCLMYLKYGINITGIHIRDAKPLSVQRPAKPNHSINQKAAKHLAPSWIHAANNV